ncbi:DinB family protein [Roseibacterium sp. SDUM158016]|uniref:DinB family protein n=1 Tax=Roseicyclus sediminis TaxID=2980997 RepID=UPI0021D14737|nr:DinB family protein [Roseibacterium sp. SDUM158016]MCU4653054.1 DinB family protein [Roseibacterium sp. SDUM158016]
MARNNAWANARLLGAVAELSQAEFEAERTGFFPSLKETLGHIWLVDLFYLDALERGGRGRAIFQVEKMPDTATDLAAKQAEADRRLIAFCDAGVGPEDTVSVGWTGGPATELVEDVLLHLFQHQVHHRGQAHAMLAGTDVAPPQLDEFFPVFDRHPDAAAYLD